MLKGTYNYHGHAFDIQAYDFDDNVAMYMTPRKREDIRFLDKGICTEDMITPASWDSLYISIGIGNVSATCNVVKEGKTRYKNELNKDCICTIAEIIRGMKTGANNNNRDTSDGLYAYTFSPNKVIRYNFANGWASLEIKTIRELHYNNGDVQLDIEDDGSFEEKIERPKLLQKFKLDLSEFVETPSDDDWDFSSDDNTIFSLSEIIERNPGKSYVWLKSRKYYIVNDESEVDRICQLIWKHDGIVAFDTETTGLYINVTSRQGLGDRLVGMVFSIEPGVAWYFPVAHKKIKNICNPGNEHSIIEQKFKPLLEKKKILCHNGAFDWKVMYIYGICTNIVHDTMIMFKMTLWNDHRSMSLGLKSLTHQILNRDSFELSDFVRGRFGSNDVKFWDLEEESVKYYACPDTDNLIELYQYCMDNDLLGQYGAKQIYSIEVAFSLVIAYQEFYGHCVDVSRIDDLVAGIKKTKEEEYAAMVQLAGHDFNPRSNIDTPRVMYDELKYPIHEYTDTGNPSCGKNARKKLMDEKNPDGSDKYPFARHLHEYLNAATLESNFTKNINKFATDDGLMFSEVNQFLETGRVSVNNPNYQSYSDIVKKYIVPRTGYYALDADYSSVEARIMVSMAKCEPMVKAMADPDMDYHTLKASQMYGIPYELVTHKQRKVSKGVNFGLLYGMGSAHLGASLYGSVSPENTRKAEQQKELYFKGMDELRTFIDKAREQGVTRYFSDTQFGRRRYFDPRKVRKDRIERQACNARIQGTAADIYKVAMVKLFTELRNNDLMGKVIIAAFVHDECFLEVSKSIDPCKMLKMLRSCMMVEIEGWCPLFIGCGYGHNWYEAKNTEIPVQVQDYLVNTFGDSGLSWWNGDVDKLCNYIVNTINEYGRDRVISYLKDENNWGKVLNPAVNAIAHNVMEAIAGGDSIEGLVDNTQKPKPDTVENIEAFCIAFGCTDLFEKANIQRPQENAVQEETQVDLDEEIDSGMPTDPESLLKDRLKVQWIMNHFTGENQGIYLMMFSKDAPFMNNVGKYIKEHPGDYDVYALSDETNEISKVKGSLDRKAFRGLSKMYMTRRTLQSMKGVR